MPFLQINGLTVPVRDVKTSMAVEPIGDSQRGVNGAWQTSERAQKRLWRMRTKPMIESEALALIGMLLGRGHGWPWEDSANAFSTTSTTGATATAAAGEHIGRSGDNQQTPVVNDAKFGFKAVSVDNGPGANMLSNATAQPSSAAGFTAVDSFAGLALASATVPRYAIGGDSVRGTLVAGVGGTRCGFRTNAVSASAATAYVGDVYVRAGTTMAVRAYLRDMVNGIDGTVVTQTLFPGRWTRFTNLTLTTGGGSPTVSLFVTQDVADTNVGIELHGCGFAIRTGTHSPAWSLAAAGAPNGTLQLSPGLVQGWRDMTFNCWVTAPDLVSGRVLYEALASKVYTGWLSQPRIRLETPGGSVNRIDFKTRASDGTEDTISTTGTPLAVGTFAMITAVIKWNPRSGETKKELWVNGSRLATSSPTLLPDLTTMSAMSFLCDTSGASEFSGAVADDLILVPWAAPSSQIAGWYASTRAQATFPQLVASGDALNQFVPDASALGTHIATPTFVHGRVDGVDFSPFVYSGTFQSNAREIEFTLQEV